MTVALPESISGLSLSSLLMNNGKVDEIQPPEGTKRIHISSCEKCNEKIYRERIFKKGQFVTLPTKHRCKEGYIPVVDVPDEGD